MENKELSAQDVIVIMALSAVVGLLWLIDSHWRDITNALAMVFWVVIGGTVVIGIGLVIYFKAGMGTSIPLTRLDRIAYLHRKRDARIRQITEVLSDRHLADTQLQIKAAVEAYYNTKIARHMEKI
jgi:hypothetical protein